MSDNHEAWRITANLHLLAHILSAVMPQPHRYGKRGSLEMKRACHTLRLAKDAWAREMSEIAHNGQVAVATQQKRWKELIGEADKRIHEGLQGLQAGKAA